MKSQQGFTLVEMLTVMLVLVAMATITVKSVGQFSFDSRYEITADRYDKIKTAILGNPNQTINGHPSVSGFVADMGRLPLNLRELLVKPTGANDWAIYGICTNATPPTTPPITTTTSDYCLNTNHGTWVSLGIGAGWRGAYIETTNDPNNSNALADGWGNLGIVNNPNYGWNFSSTANSISITSLGKDGELDKDRPFHDMVTGLCPQNTGSLSNATGSCTLDQHDNDFPQYDEINGANPIASSNDWQSNQAAISIIITNATFDANSIDRPIAENSCRNYGGLWNSPVCLNLGSAEYTQSQCEDTSIVNGTWNTTYLHCSKIKTSICLDLYYRDIGIVKNAISPSSLNAVSPFTFLLPINLPTGQAAFRITKCNGITYPIPNRDFKIVDIFPNRSLNFDW